MMIEPPSQLGRAAVFEIHDGVFIAVEEFLLEELLGTVKQAREHELRRGVEARSEEIRENGGGACAVEAPIVIKKTNPHFKKATRMAHSA